VLQDLARWAEARDVVDGALAADPTAAVLWIRKAIAQAALGDLLGARASFEACLAANPSSLGCRLRAVEISQYRGECERYEREARALVADAPENPTSYRELAEALASRGRSPEAIEELLRQSGVRAGATDIPNIQQLMMLRGDFEGSVTAHRQHMDSAPVDSAKLRHLLDASSLFDTYFEMGAREQAATFADTLLKRDEAWSENPRADDVAILLDSRPQALEAMYRAGRITRAEFFTRRDAWAEHWVAAIPPYYRGFVWFSGYAATAETADEAQEALAKLPSFGPIPPFDSRRNVPSETGKVYFLAGRVDEALPYLKAGAGMCDALEVPVRQTVAHYWLGRALEAKGDRAQACEAYAVVLSRWGHAKPGSVHARQARAHAQSLGCAR
jgi:tetratricopeptide (TPR) repeat protein